MVLPARPLVPPAVVSKIKSSVISGGTSLEANSTVILVCGAQSSSGVQSGRDVLLDYAAKHLRQFRFFRAENVFDALQRASGRDLLSLEGELAGFSDCILIVLESPGAIAELGAFAFDKGLARIVLLVNDNQFRNNHSFITDGPVAMLNRKSHFRPVIHADLKHIMTAEPDIEDRLNKIKRTYKQPTDLSSYDRFADSGSKGPKTRLLFIADLVSLLSPISYQELIVVLSDIYGHRQFRITVELAVLESVGLLRKTQDRYIRSLEERGLFYRYHMLDEIAVRAEVVTYYYRYVREKALGLAERALGLT